MDGENFSRHMTTGEDGYPASIRR